jgi:KaiC/GvpD/RAD55 family RecA-like ATPase
VPKIPLIEDLTTGPIPPGSNMLVEYDSSPQLYNASLTIAAGWIRTSGTASYNVAAQPPDRIRSQLKRLGLDTEQLELNDKLRITDWYTSSLGRKSREKYAYDSLKVSDMSLNMAKIMSQPPRPSYLRIMDNYSIVASFNDEKAWVEYALTRALPSAIQLQSSNIIGIVSGLHSDWVYKNLETAVDGVIDFRLEESGEETKNLIRIRNMRNVGFDSRWHRQKTTETFEIAVEK